jgi:hypothetical protein
MNYAFQAEKNKITANLYLRSSLQHTEKENRKKNFLQIPKVKSTHTQIDSFFETEYTTQKIFANSSVRN